MSVHSTQYVNHIHVYGGICRVKCRFSLFFRRNKKVNFYNEELCESGSDSQGTLSKSTSREPPELETVVSLPPKGEKPDRHVCDPSSGQLTGT